MKKKYKIIILSSLIILAITLIIGLTYAYYIFNVSQSGSNALQTDCFKVTYNDYNPINLSNTIPMSDEDAMELTPYTIVIKNVCNHGIDYDINVETLENTTMNLNGIRVKLDNYKSQILGDIEDNDSSAIVNNNALSSKTIKHSSMVANGIKIYNLRMYIDENSTKEQTANKSFLSKIVVSTKLNTNFDGAILDSGIIVNQKIKELSGDVNPTGLTENTTIKSIERSLEAPREEDNAIIVSQVNTVIPIYTWFKDGVIYLYSDAKKIFLNDSSSYLFTNLKGVENIDLSYFDTSIVTNMAFMFRGMSNLTSLDVSNFDTSNVTDMGSMFSYMSSLTTLDISNFNTSNATNMSSMFFQTSNLTSLNLSNFDTSKVTDMSTMFSSMTNLTSLNISNFDTSNVTDMKYMFSATSSLTELDISSFDTSKVTDMSSMFSQMNNVTKIYVGNKWNVSNDCIEQNLFLNNNNLVGGAGTTYSYSNRSGEYARVDDPDNGKPGYLTLLLGAS